MHVVVAQRSLSPQNLPSHTTALPAVPQWRQFPPASFCVTSERTLYEDIWRRTAAVSLLSGRRPSASVRAVERPQVSSQVSEQQGQRREAEHGFLLRHIAGDGRCMFRALVQGAHLIRAGQPTTPAMEAELADELRKRVCQELLDSRDQMSPFIDGDYDTYVAEMADVQTWGGEPELALAAEVLQLPITVYQREQGSAGSDGSLTETSCYGADYKDDGAPSIAVLFDGVGHYDLLLPSADEDGTQPAVHRWTKSKL